jgi:hypothetical protein
MGEQFQVKEVVKYFTQNFGDPTLSCLRINVYPASCEETLVASYRVTDALAPPTVGERKATAKTAGGP